MNHARCILALALAAALVPAAAFAGNEGNKSGADKLAGMDSNMDGRLSADEHANGARSMFEKMDADADGRVTAAEMDAHKASKGHAVHGKSASEKIAALDGDGDGALTAQEHATGAQEMFSRMDSDTNGFVSAAEMDAGHTAMLDDEEPRSTAQEYE